MRLVMGCGATWAHYLKPSRQVMRLVMGCGATWALFVAARGG